MKKKEESIDTAVEAAKNQNYPVAKKIFEELAQQNDPHALCNLGFMYLNGHGGERDKEKGIELLESASAKGSVEADYHLGLINLQTARTQARAKRYFQKAALAGHKDAEGHWGCLLVKERATLRKGIELLEKVIAEPEVHSLEVHSKALYTLGRVYQQGLANHENSKKDESTARKYFLAAADKGNSDASYQLARMFREEKKDEEAIDWFDKAAKQGQEKAKGHLKQYEDNYRTGVERTSKTVPLLIKALKQILGDDYKKDLDEMVDKLWYKGVPLLKEGLFYHYEYEIYASLECIPKNKERGIVYLYVEEDKLQYQVLTNLGLCNGTLDVQGFNLERLKAVSFIGVPPLHNMREIYYRYNSHRCNYEVIDDNGNLQLGHIGVVSANMQKDKQQIIEDSLLKEVIDKKYCLESKTHVSFLKSKLQQQLIQNGYLEPSYENKFSLIQRIYEEILLEEIKISLFLKRLTAVLESDKFKAIFENPEDFVKLSFEYIPIIQQLNKEQQTLTKPLKSVITSSQEVIDNFKRAYIGTINHANYCQIVIFIQALQALIDKEIERDAVTLKQKIESFCKTSPYFLPAGELQNPQAIFTAQFLTRRLLLLNTFATANFKKGYDKLEELEPAFIALQQLAAMANKALPENKSAKKDEKDPVQMLSEIQSAIKSERNELKIKCFELMRPIIRLLVLEMNEVDLITILKRHAVEKRELITCLSDFKIWCQDLQCMPLVEKIEKIEKEINEKGSLASMITSITDLLVSINTLFPKKNESGEDKEASPAQEQQAMISYELETEPRSSELKGERRSSRVNALLDKFTISPRQRAASVSQKIDGDLSIINGKKEDKEDFDMLPAGGRSPGKRPPSLLLGLEGEGRRASVSSRSDVASSFPLALEHETQSDTSLSRPDSCSEDRVSPLSLANKTQETSGLDDKKQRPSFKTSEFFSFDSAKESKAHNTPVSLFFDGVKEIPSPASPRQSSVLASSSPATDKGHKDKGFRWSRLSPRLHSSRRSSRSESDSTVPSIPPSIKKTN